MTGGDWIDRLIRDARKPPKKGCLGVVVSLLLWAAVFAVLAADMASHK